MCGIAGVLRRDRGTGPQPDEIASAMAALLAHRGPDDAGTWSDSEAGIAFSHRRLAILDLSPAGHQPMTDPSGRWAIVLNGEIYNHRALRKELEQADPDAVGRFRGHSDTEVLLGTLSQWGMEATLPKLEGQFAFAAWDASHGRLHLVRDRLGEKPLYYGSDGHTFRFASEAGAFRADPAWQGVVDPEALYAYARLGYVPAPLSIYRGLRKLPAGHFLTLGSNVAPDAARPVPYWAPTVPPHAGPAPTDARQEVDDLENLLKDAVRGALESDVPVGVFLSGGIDSSTIAALAGSVSPQPLNTFTVAFEEAAYDEAEFARNVADHLGTRHTETSARPEDLLALVERMPAVYQEPFADSSQLPTLLICQKARQAVKVALSGDGGDELFGGYNRHSLAKALYWDGWSRRLDRLPSGLRRLLGRALRAPSEAAWNRVAALRAPSRRRRQLMGGVGQRLHKLADIVSLTMPSQVYSRLVSLHEDPRELLVDGTGAASLAWPPMLDQRPVEGMMLADLLTYLPDDLLVKVDRASMHVGLEVRAPFLHHRVVEHALNVSPHLKFRDDQTKWILRQVLYRHVPRSLVDRAKSGFAVPLAQWLRGPLRDWAEELLSDRHLRATGAFRIDIVRKRWADHVAGRHNWAPQLWAVLMYQSWHDAFHPQTTASSASTVIESTPPLPAAP